ncbi:hypothetical protein [Bradyrhizobium manausense]|uniref:Uncharacterized protein n=1 Tax=Bradyrhizobium manausense TaxID=989370 RepID=A0A0R3D0I0_9BRAD|nr:hypothetical protein [Bradyrhizobium manausense]KRQ03286.1 hypothetical protein AOQ71_31660 [Bradyrhizobium manausense]
MSTTAASIVTTALRLYGVLDQTEQPGPADIANNVAILNDLLRNEHMHGAAQYLMRRITATVPAGVQGSIYSFSIGTASSSYLVQSDIVGIKDIWCNDVSPTVNRETQQAPIADVVRTTFLGLPTKWHQERQVDGSVTVTLWQPPRKATAILLDVGGRISPLTATDGSDIVALPPEGAHDAALLLGMTVMSSYGRNPASVSAVLARAQQVDKRWREWCLGAQWLRFVRS